MIIYHHSRGKGLINKLINKLPFELHLPGYQYCGPGTKLAKRLDRGDPGVNPLDAACKEHDIAYSKNRENVEKRNAADRVLADKAWQRVFAPDARYSERAAAYAITNAMKAKSKFGMGVKKKKIKSKKRVNLRKIVDAARKSIIPGNDARSTIKSAIETARKAVRNAGGREKVLTPRILPVPSKVGGLLPLIPIFAGLSALGALTGGAAGVAKAVNDASAAKEQLKEAQRHNRELEAVALGKGLHLKPYRQGLGLHLKPYVKGQGIKRQCTKKKV
ncbi:uncharacterized protein LOC122504497 [Leptopilina heterotoma]|uniref:uncharacterized protein LOC122504497 n=1 Tax=Leptopilina heterotoma TaxID=63436 RepID=UPI001CA91E3E|nr:uncharacterized protein LOC122504497 [Leptopilina heterotoma]